MCIYTELFTDLEIKVKSGKWLYKHVGPLIGKFISPSREKIQGLIKVKIVVPAKLIHIDIIYYLKRYV